MLKIYTSSAVVQYKSGARFIVSGKYLLSTVNIYERWYVFIHMCMQINYSLFLNYLNRARSVSMDALMTRYSMLSEALSRRRREISH